MIVGTIIKTPFEAIDTTVDFTARLGDETVTSFTVTATTASGGNATSTIIATFPTPAQSGGVVSFRVQGGVANCNYFAIAQVVTSAGEQFQGTISVQVTTN
jgi:hypothetical protein